MVIRYRSVNCAIALLAVTFVAVVSPIQPARAAVPFTEEAAARGLTYITVSSPSAGAGVAFVDLDSDGDPDVVVVGRADGVVGVFENIGGGMFVDRSLGSGIPAITDFSGVVAADYDLDGRLDLYFSNYFVPNVLCRNEGNFRFSDTSVTAGVDDAGWGMGCAWGDYDGDGWPDLYLSNRSVPPPDGGPVIPNRLYHNRQDGTFEDVAVSLGVDLASDDRVTLQAVFFDFDNDADADLYTSTDKGTITTNNNNNRLFENIGGSFADVSIVSGTDVAIDSMGVAVGDFDGNGYQDLYCTNVWPGHKLLLNNGDGTFTESAAIAGVEVFSFGWGAAFFDYDNDGYQDLYISDMVAANQLYAHTGTWPATNVALALGVADPGRSFGIAIADIDDDGDIDLVVQDNDEPLKLYINHEGELRNWIKFAIIGQGGDRFAIGTQVRVRTGTVWQIREILAGGNNYKGQNEFTVHFGLGPNFSVDEVVVTWPGGHTETFTNLAANRTHLVTPLGDVPTVSAWGLVLMSVGLVVLATLLFRTRCARLVDGRCILAAGVGKGDGMPGKTHSTPYRVGAFAAVVLAAGYQTAHSAEPFTEEAIARGVDYTLGIGASGFGAAFADLDNDGDVDLITVGSASGAVGLYENDGTGNFTDRFVGSGIPLISAMGGVTLADYDNDGDLDIYLSNWRIPNVLLRNDGGFSFTDVSVAAGVADGGAAAGCAWGDFDNDNHIDLYVANRLGSGGPPIVQRLFHNQGDGTFLDVAPELGVNYQIVLFQAVFFDFDLDNDADLYLSGDKCGATGNPNRLFRNDGGTFTDISAGSGADVCIGSMGVGIGDVNQDGWPDLYCTDIPPDNVMLVNQGGDGTFIDDAIASGLESDAIGWAAIFFDYDNDGRDDLFVSNNSDVNRLYDNDGVWPIPDVAAALQVDDPGSSFGAAVGDVDGDGDLDLLVPDNGDRVRLFINHEGENRNWIKFHVRGFGQSYVAIGANVRISVGSTSQRKEVIAGGNGFKGQNELIVHFGIDSVQSVDEVVVTWPGGLSRTLTNLAANRTYLVSPLGDIPTLSAWGLVMMSVGLVVFATLLIRNRVVSPENVPPAP